MPIYEEFLAECIVIFLEIRLIEGDYPNDGDSRVWEAVETLAATEVVRANLVERMSAAEDAGLVFALPSTEDLAKVRERRLAR
jgi:hypothetical protein